MSKCYVGPDGTVEVAVAEATGDVTYNFRKSSGQVTQLLYNDGLGGGDINLLSDDVLVQSFSCGRLDLVPGSGRPEVIQLVLNLYKNGLTVDEQATNQTFYTTVTLRTY